MNTLSERPSRRNPKSAPGVSRYIGPRYAVLALMLGWPIAAGAAEPTRAEATAAAPGAAPTAAEKDTARSLARDGDTFFAEGQYEPALARYAAAYHLVRVPTLGLQVAKTRAALGRLSEALAVAREVERMRVQAGEPPIFAGARQKAKELAVDLGARVPRMHVEVAPAGIDARISVDGVAMPLASSPDGVELDAGLHRLVVSADGYSSVELEFELHERDRERLPVTLFARPGRAAPVAAAASERNPASAAGAGDAQPSAAPSEDGSHDARRDASDSARSARTRGHVGLALAGIGLAGGAVTGVLAFTTKPDCPSDTCDASQGDDIEASKRFGNIATISFAAGGAFLAYGLWELLANGAEPDRAAASEPRALGATLIPSSDGGVELRVTTAF